MFNITTNLKNKDLLSPEIVKTIIDKENYIKDYFRLSKIKNKKKFKIKEIFWCNYFKKRIN